LITPVDGPGGPGGPGGGAHDPGHLGHLGHPDDPDDPLAVLLRPPGDRLAAPPGRFEAVRRSAARRRTLRAVAGAGLACGALLAVLLPLGLAHHTAPGPRLAPVAPATTPRHTRPSTPSTATPSQGPSPSARPSPSGARRSADARVATHSPDAATRGRADSPVTGDGTGSRSGASPRR
jgi:hypothetical protein